MKIKVAIVGFGFMGKMHAKVYSVLPDVEIVGIVDPHPDAREEAQSFKAGIPVLDSLESLLKTLDVDVVDICLPTDLHTESIITAARAHKHVFCEKPIALSEAEARAVIAETEKYGVLFQIGHCIRFWPEYQALEKFIRSGKGGKLTSLSLQRRSSRPPYSREQWLHKGSRSMGAALDLHIHDTDYVLHILGKPRQVHSIGRKEADAFTHLYTNYVYDNVSVTAEGGWDYPSGWGFQMAFQAVFENAAIEFDSRSSQSLYLTQADGSREPLAFEKPAVSSGHSSGGNISDLNGYYNELNYFCDCVRKKKAPEIATGKQALESLRTVLAEIRSAESKLPVTL